MSFTLVTSFAFCVYLVFSLDCDDYFECESQTVGSDRLNCYGYGSCSEVVIDTEHGVRCDGDRACYNAEITADESISCRSVASCEGAALTTDDDVYCEGVQGCVHAEINGNGKVYSYGHYGTVNAKITGASMVRGYGYYSLLFATIDSGDSSKLSVKVFGVDSGYGANVICRSGASCTLTCKAGGCLNLDYICLDGASCSVSPEQCLNDNSVDSYDGISCPTWKVSASLDDDDTFTQYMEQKEIDKEDDIKWNLFQSYIADDVTLFESRLEAMKQNKVLSNDNIGVSQHIDTNIYAYLVIAFCAVIMATLCCCRSKLANITYQKV